MVVDALDLCYTKGHVDTFVIISGDSDFSPLVSKLRENAKTVIGVGVKKSSSDLFINNCDQFIYYDDLVRVTPSKVNTRSASTSSDAKAAESKGLTVAKAFSLASIGVNYVVSEVVDRTQVITGKIPKKLFLKPQGLP